jgi:hypothetical protein
MRLPDVISIQNRFALDAQPLWPLRSAISATNRAEVVADRGLSQVARRSHGIGLAQIVFQRRVRAVFDQPLRCL